MCFDWLLFFRPVFSSKDDDLDLLDGEFDDLLGDVADVANSSALHVKNDDDLLQEMEELLA